MGYHHPEDWAGHDQYSTQPTTCTNELNVNELNVNELNVGGGGAVGLHVCVCTIATVHALFTVVVCGKIVVCIEVHVITILCIEYVGNILNEQITQCHVPLYNSLQISS